MEKLLQKDWNSKFRLPHLKILKIIDSTDYYINFKIIINDCKYIGFFRFDDGIYLPTCYKLDEIITNLEIDIGFVEYLSSFIYPKSYAKYNIYFNNDMVSFDNFTVPINLVKDDLIILIKLMHNIRKKSDDKHLIK